MTDRQAQLRRKIIRLRVALVVITVPFVALCALITLAIFNGDEATTTQTPNAISGEASFGAEVAAVRVINPARVVVDVNVTNQGSASGQFTCKVAVTDSSGTYRGFDYFQDERGALAPGGVRRFSGELTVTNEGAVFATSASVDC